MLEKCLKPKRQSLFSFGWLLLHVPINSFSVMLRLFRVLMAVIENTTVFVYCSFNRKPKRESLFEPPHGKTNNLHMRKQRRRSVTAKLISAFVFATWIVQSLFYLYPKFQASSTFLCLCILVCVGPVRKPHCWFSHEMAHSF